MSTLHDTRYLAELLGTGIPRVNKLVSIAQLGSKTKSRRANGRGENRRYSAEEICRVALTYWLFRTGLRGPFISAILAKRRVSSFIAQLNTVKRIQAEAGRQRSLVAWGFTTTRKAKRWKVEVEGCEFVTSLGRAPTSVRNHGCVILPVGRLLQQLTEKMLD